MAAAEKLKAGGMEHPIVYEFDQELPNFWDAFVAQSYGRGGDLFDADGKAIFDNPDNPAYKQLEWLAEAFKKDLVQQETHELKIIPSMNAGKHAFTVVYNYMLAGHEQRRRAAARRALRARARCRARRIRRSASRSSIRSPPRRRRPGARRSGLEVRELHGRQTLHGRQALGGGEGARLRPAARSSTIQTFSKPGTSGSTSDLKEQVVARPRRHVDRVDLGMGRLFPPAPRQAMVGEATVDEIDEGRRRKVERISRQIAKN